MLRLYAREDAEQRRDSNPQKSALDNGGEDHGNPRAASGDGVPAVCEPVDDAEHGVAERYDGRHGRNGGAYADELGEHGRNYADGHAGPHAAYRREDEEHAVDERAGYKLV